MKVRILILFFLLIISLLFNVFTTGHTNVLENFVLEEKTEFYDKVICDNILEHSIKTTDKEYEKKIKEILILKKNDVHNLMKFTDGTIKWSRWFVNTNENIKHLMDAMYFNVIKKVCKYNIVILFYKLNKYRLSLCHSGDILMDFDFVFYTPNDFYAYHINIACVLNKKSYDIYYLYVENVGKISQDKLDTSICQVSNDNLVNVDFPNEKYEELPDHDSFYSLISDDDELRKVLSKNLVYDSVVDNIDYHKNIQYNNDQEIIRNMFLSGMKDNKSNICSTNKYKNYPYKSDIVIINNDID